MTDPGAAGVEPSWSVEVELKFDVAAETGVPEWATLPGVASVGPGEVRELDAAYLDTSEYALAHAGYALRRRTGGPDAGWHIKGPRAADGGRVELHWALGSEASVPDGARAVVAGITADPLVPIARIRNTRTAYPLRDAAGALVAEFADDRVSAIDELTRTERQWREWEFELGPAAPAGAAARRALLDAAAAAMTAAGARPAASASKLARALGV